MQTNSTLRFEFNISIAVADTSACFCLFGLYVEELVSARDARHGNAALPQIVLLIFSDLLVLCVCCAWFLRELTRSGMTIGLGKEIPDAIYKYSPFTPLTRQRGAPCLQPVRIRSPSVTLAFGYCVPLRSRFVLRGTVERHGSAAGQVQRMLVGIASRVSKWTTGKQSQRLRSACCFIIVP